MTRGSGGVTPYYADDWLTVYQGDNRVVMAEMPAESVHCVVTSPPYWGLRDYGDAGQLGLEPTPEEYVANLVDVFREVRRVLRSDGTVWLNLGSSYFGGGNGGGGSFASERPGWDGMPSGAGASGRSRSRPPSRAPAYGTDGTGPQGSPVLGSACSDLCDECLGDYRNHLSRNPDTLPPLDEAEQPPMQTVRDTEPPGSAEASPDASLLGARESTTLRSWRLLRGSCSRCDSRAAALSDARSSASDAPASAGMSWLKYTSALKPKDMVPIPWMVAMALQADGWYLRSDIIWCLSAATRLYARTGHAEGPMPLGDLTRLDPASVALWNGERWTQVLGWSSRKSTTLRLTLRSGERIIASPGHRWPLADGRLVETSALAVGDVLSTTTLPEPETPSDAAISADLAWFAGLYLAEGSRSGDAIQIAGHAKEVTRHERVADIARRFGGTSVIHPGPGNGVSQVVHGAFLRASIEHFIAGRTALDKHVHPRAWQSSNATLRAFMEGYLAGDGHWDAKNRRWRLGYGNNAQWTDSLRTLAARLGATLTVSPALVRMGRTMTFKAYRGEWRWEARQHRNAKPRAEVVKIDARAESEVWDVGVDDAPHTFTLASGILTHNSKPNPMPESVTDRPTKSHEYLFLLSKSPRYYFDADAVRESVTPDMAQRASLGYTRGGNGKLDISRGDHDTLRGEAAKAITDSGRNIRSVWTIATAPYKGAHFACVDDVTEALTPSGWRRHDELADSDEIAAYVNGTVMWQPATFHRYAYEGDLVAIEKRDTSQRLTPNHRCLIRTRDGYERTVRADGLTAAMSVPTSAPWDIAEMTSVGLDMATLLGWYIAEGWRSSARVIGISQSESANPRHVVTIRSLLDAVGAEYSEKRRERTWRGRPAVDVEWRVRGPVAKALMTLAPDKRLAMSMVGLPVAEAQALLGALVDGDGHRRVDGRSCIVQKDRQSIDAMQVLALRLGYRAHLSKRRDGIFVLYLTEGRWLTLRGSKGTHKPMGRERYEGTVWCPNVPSGYWLARRDGKPFITGNTFPRKLVEPCIKAGTSERGVCPECGAPWERVVNATKYEPLVVAPGVRNVDASRGDKVRKLSGADYNEQVKRTTTGWQPTCKHDAEPVPATVLDIFGGSGTTGLVAQSLSRRAILIDLNGDYLVQAMGRNRDIPLGLVS